MNCRPIVLRHRVSVTVKTSRFSYVVKYCVAVVFIKVAHNEALFRGKPTASALEKFEANIDLLQLRFILAKNYIQNFDGPAHVEQVCS